MTPIYILLVLFTSWQWNWVAFIVVLILDSMGTGYFVRDGQEYSREEYQAEYGIDPEDDPNLEDAG